MKIVKCLDNGDIIITLLVSIEPNDSFVFFIVAFHFTLSMHEGDLTSRLSQNLTTYLDNIKKK